MECKTTITLLKLLTFCALIFLCQYSVASSQKTKIIVDEVSKIYLSSVNYIFENQDLINESFGDKSNLFGQKFINNIKQVYQRKYNKDFPLLDHVFKRTLIETMVEVMEDNRALIYDIDLGFKGLIPATFAFQISRKLSFKGVGLKIKFTRGAQYVRNKLNFPDYWESKVMEQAEIKPRVFYDENATLNGKPVFRKFIPLPMQPYCLNCHGKIENNPLNIGKERSEWTNVDMTGFTMENWTLADFGGGISMSFDSSIFE